MQQPITDIFEKIFICYGTLKAFPMNKIIFEKGDVADSVAYIKSGQVRAVVTNPDGDETTLFYLSAGDVFGSDSLSSVPFRVVTVQAVCPCEIYLLSSGQFSEIWQKNNYPLKELHSHYIKRIALLSDYICCSHFNSAKKKTAYFLNSYSYTHGDTITLTNEQIGTITGMTRISVNRSLNELAQENIVSIKYRKIKIIDKERLRDTFDRLGYFLE